MAVRQQDKLLAYYRNVEFFKPFDYSKLPKEIPKSIQIFRNSDEALLPWNNVDKYKLNPEYEYAFDFFIAPFSVEAAIRTVANLIPDVSKPISELTQIELPGLSCIARLEIRKNIGINFDECALSTFPWALTELAKGVRLSLNNFDLYAEAWSNALGLIAVPEKMEQIKLDLPDEVLKDPSKLPGIYPTVKQFDSFSAVCAKSLTFEVCPSDLLGTLVIRRGQKIKKQNNESDTPSAAPQKIKRKIDILNSFFLRDLERIANGDSGIALNRFLSENSSSVRVDIRQQSYEKDKFISEIERFTIHSRWPFPENVELSREQQLAVGWFLNDLPEHSAFKTPIVAVNGPPGTGKSSLVKQILAELVVRRGLILSKLKSPRDAFIENQKRSVRLGGFEINYRPLRLELCQLGLMIVSNNNGAVENLTKELPRKDLLPKELPEPTYLRPVAERLGSISEKDLDWWGLPTIPLGRKSNRILFKQCLSAFKSTESQTETEKLAGLSLVEYRSKAPEAAKSFNALQKEFLIAFDKSQETPTDKTELFNKALLLCEAWIREVPNLEQELRALGDLLLRPRSFSSSEAKELWNILFMIVPAVSTTLASVEKMLPGVPSGSIPYLIVEEAGQASPQSVLGALLRSKKALFIGDQRQLEPITNVPDPLNRYLQDTLSVTPLASAQSIADEISMIGTAIRDHGDRNIWLGLPLIDHRRCDEPMFSLSNNIAYGNMMRNCVHREDTFPLSLESKWLQVTGSCSDGHWVDEQGAILETLLARIYAEISAPDVFIISPFRSVKNSVSSILKKLDETLFAPETGRPSFGTVHTFQGKEADIVILILGCDFKKLGAADWAGEKPNLLNVALTRAKRRLFVIGDRDVWHGRGYFSDLVHGISWTESLS
jgi:hypothetical protein